MRRTPLATLLAALLLAAVPAAADAARGVLVMDARGNVRVHGDGWAASVPREAAPRAAARVASARAARPSRTTVRGSVTQVLSRLRSSGAVLPEGYRAWAAQWRDARKALKRLKGTRRTELRAVVANLTALAKAGRLTPSRAPQAFLTLDRNRRWWTTGPLLAYGQRVGFAGSELVWQHYPGQGIQIQWLGTFGKANAAYSSKDDERLRRLLTEALSLGARRAGGIAFEYTFEFDGGRPPWVSGLAQGTGIQALSRAAIRLRDSSFFQAARSALGIFRTRPPQGVAVRTKAGTHYLQYSFAPKLRIANGFVQALNGLHDFAIYANDAEGRALFAAGEAELRRELPGFDTGAWSLYSIPGGESDLGYHELLRDFLRSLCSRLEHDADKGRTFFGDATPYCAAAERFTGYLTTPPVPTVADQRARARQRHRLRFAIDKVSTVTVTLLRGGTVAYRTSFRAARGGHYVNVTPRKRGPLAIGVHAVDLAGNPADATATLRVRPPKKRAAK